jgi:uncharacterized protein (TIGR03435 family)
MAATGWLAGVCQAGVVWVGQRAPDLTIETLINAPVGARADLASLRGKAVVVEFFSIECPKCLAAMPHYTQLARSMQGKPVQFISVTNEPEPAVRDFFLKNPVAQWVGIDSDWSMWRDYTVLGVPLAIVINPAGVITALVHPDDLNEQLIYDAINGKTPAATLSELFDDPSAPTTLDNKAIPLMKIEVKPAPHDERTVIWSAEQFRAKGATLADLLSESLNIEPYLFVSDDLLLDAKYDVTISPPANDVKMVSDMLRAVIEQMAHPRLKKITRPIPVYVLRARPAGAMHLKPGGDETPSITGGDGHVIATNVPISEIVGNLVHDLRMPVVDETGLTKSYSFEFSWDVNDPQSLIKALQTQIGLDVRKENRPMEVYLVKRGE